MNIETLEKLSQNPHYKLSAKQKEELAKHRMTHAITFGKPQMHDNTIHTHPNLKRRASR